LFFTELPVFMELYCLSNKSDAKVRITVITTILLVLNILLTTFCRC